MLYFDHSATTPIHPQVLLLMREIEGHHFGNPSSVHRYGRKARSLVENARRQMATAIGCKPREIIFTSGGTEANNLVLWNLLHGEHRHVITSAIEHPAVLNTVQALKTFGVETTLLPVDKNGLVDPQQVEQAIRSDTGLVTIMYTNNEIGTIEPLREIARIAHEHEIWFHSDGVQAPGKLPIQVKQLGVDLMSFSGHKFYGPKGVGALYVNSKIALHPLMVGGGQEKKRRAGTENVAGIAGMGKAMELAIKDEDKNRKHLQELAKIFQSELTTHYPHASFNGDPRQHLPGLVNITLPGIPNDLLLIHLDNAGIAISSGSACSSGTVSPSHVLKAIGLSREENLSTIRISFGRSNTVEEVSILVEKLVEAIQTSKRLK
jgi:cysteine desulfurase